LWSKNPVRSETAAVVLFIYLVYLIAAFTLSDMFHGGTAHLFMLLHGYALCLYAEEKAETRAAAARQYAPAKAAAAPAR
jgi:hypothetical protein